MDVVVPLHAMLPVVLPGPALLSKWLEQCLVPAVGIGVITGDEVTIGVYGELSKGIPAPRDTIWGSEALMNILLELANKKNDIDDTILQDFFANLDMVDTFVGDPVAVLSRMARPHNKREGIYVFKPQDMSRKFYTTLSDVCKLLVRVKPGIDTLFVNRSRGNGASHAIILLPQSKQAIVIFTNSDNGSAIEDRIFESWKLNFKP